MSSRAGRRQLRTREDAHACGDDISPTSTRLSLDVPIRSFNYHLHFSVARHGYCKYQARTSEVCWAPHPASRSKISTCRDRHGQQTLTPARSRKRFGIQPPGEIALIAQPRRKGGYIVDPRMRSDVRGNHCWESKQRNHRHANVPS